MTTQLSATCVDEILAAADEIGLPAGRVALAAADLRCALVRPLDPTVVERHVRVLEREAVRLQHAGRTPPSETVRVARTGARLRRKGLAAAAILACGLFTTGGLAAAGLIDGTPRSIVESVANQLGLGFVVASGNDEHNGPGADGTGLPHGGTASTSSTSSAPAHTTSPARSSWATQSEPATKLDGDTTKRDGSETPSAEDLNSNTPNPNAGNGNPDPDPGNPNAGAGTGAGNGNPDPGNPNPGNPNPGNPNPGKPAK